MGFSVINSQGCIKVTPAGTGATLADPLPPTHGGTGLTQFSQGDTLACYTTDQWVAVAKDTDDGRTPVKVFWNNFIDFPSATLPRWGNASQVMSNAGAGIPHPAGYPGGGPKLHIAEATAGSAFNGNSIALAALTTAGATSVTDSTSTWMRLTTGTLAGDLAGWNAGTAHYWFDHEPFCKTKFRTPATVTSVRFTFALYDGSNLSLSGTSDDFSARKLVGLRYSTGAGDTNWMTFTGDGTTQATTDTGVAFAASTVYTMSVKVRKQTTENYVADFNINGTSITGIVVPTAALRTGISPAFAVTALAAASARTVDCTSMYFMVNRDQTF